MEISNKKERTSFLKIIDGNKNRVIYAAHAI